MPLANAFRKCFGKFGKSKFKTKNYFVYFLSIYSNARTRNAILKGLSEAACWRGDAGTVTLRGGLAKETSLKTEETRASGQLELFGSALGIPKVLSLERR